MAGPVHVVLDIDQVLACTQASYHQAIFFQRRGAIISAIMPHYIFPGVLEFIQVLGQTEGIKFSFFSAGDARRNEILVDALLKRALPEVKYHALRDKIRICSKEHLTTVSANKKRKHESLFGFSSNPQIKDLRKIVSEEELSNTVLIDDNLFVAAPDQRGNLLLVPEMSAQKYDKLPQKKERYLPDGYRHLECVLGNADAKAVAQKQVRSGKQIVVLKTEEGFSIQFLDRSSHRYQSKELSTDNDQELKEKLTQFHEHIMSRYQPNPEGMKYLYIPGETHTVTDASLAQSILSFVARHDGIHKKIKRKANAICYAVGTLMKALQQSKEKNVPITEILFKMQFKPKADGTFATCFRERFRQDEIYKIGWEALRQVNPDFTWTSPHQYMAVITPPLSFEEKKELKTRITPNSEDCCVM